MPDRTILRKRRRTLLYDFEPMTMTWTEVATFVFRIDPERGPEAWLRDHLKDYPDFPRPDPAIDTFATEAVRAWVRRRFGLASLGLAAEDDGNRLLGPARASKRGALSGRTAA